MNKVASYFQYLFDIKRDEIVKSVLLQTYVFILITTLLIVKPTINSIFLSELTSEALPTAYLVTALFAVIFSWIYNKVLNIISLKQVISRTLILSVLLLVCFSLALQHHPSFKYWLYIPYLFVAIYGLLTTSQFWLLSNLVFNIRQAKRIFGFIGSGAIAGGIFGGYLTSFLSNFIISEQLLLVAAGLLFLCVPINQYIWKRYIHKSKKDLTQKNRIEKHPLTLIKSSKLVTFMTVAMAVGVIVAKLIDYQYSHFASEKIPNTEELTAFFGFWFSTLSIISLVIQLFLTKRILSYFGIGKTLLLLPLGILLGSVLLIIIPELWVVVIIKIADGSLKQSVNKAGIELLSLPIPVEIKTRTKVFIDVVVDSIATGIAGILLIFVINGLEISSVQISFVTISLILIWIFLISKIYKNYLVQFKTLITGLNGKKKPEHDMHLNTSLNSVYDTITSVFKNGTEAQIAHMLEELLLKPDEHYFEAIKNLLNHPSKHIRQLALHNLYYLKSENLSERVKEILSQETDTAPYIIELLQYLIHKNPHLKPSEFDQLVSLSPHKDREALGMLALSSELTSEDLQSEFELTRRISKLLVTAKEAADPKEAELLFECIFSTIGRLHLHEFYDKLIEGLQHPNELIARSAVNGIGFTKSSEFYTTLIDHLSKPHLKHAIIKAFHEFDPNNIIPLLKESATTYNIPTDTACILPKIIGNFEVHESVDALIYLTEHSEYSVSIKALEALEKLVQSFPHLKIDKSFIITNIISECEEYRNLIASIQMQVDNEAKLEQNSASNKIAEARKGLIHILEHRIDSQLMRIFKLLGIRYVKDDIVPVLNATLSKEENTRANAIEFIENILESELKSIILPILDIANIDTPYSKDILHKLQIKSYSEYECYEILLMRQDVRIKHSLLYLLEQINDRSYNPLIQMALKDRDPRVRSEALELKQKLGLV